MSTPFRSDTDALRERCNRLAAELDTLRAQRRAIDALTANEAGLERELTAAREALSAHADPVRRLPLLDKLTIAAPCNASWEQMAGDERVRHCGQCDKHVYNLSAMTRSEAETLLQASGERPCVRFYRRTDGTVMTSDCSVGVKRRNRRRIVAAAALSATAASAAATALAGASMGARVPTEHTSYSINEPLQMVQGGAVAVPMGVVAVPPTPPPQHTMGEPMMGAPPPLPPPVRPTHTMGRPRMIPTPVHVDLRGHKR